jgi:hypothetical protein
MNHSPIRFHGCNMSWLILFVSVLTSFSGCKRTGGAADAGGTDDSLKGPATVEQAARVIDLTTFPLMDGAAANPNRAVASLNYSVPKTNVKSAFDFQRQKLAAQGWKESSKDTSVSEQAASATFARKGFILSVSAYPSGGDGGVAVALNNHGNIDFSKLSRPGDAKPLYVGDATAMYVTTAAVPVAAEECRKLLLAQDWQPYGLAGDSNWFKQNAVRLCVTVSSAPAQGGKTAISYSSELMSADLPAPDKAEDLRYSDTSKELSFETAATKEAMVDFYKQKLGPMRWESTLDKTVDVDDKPTMIFRNPAKDMLTLSFAMPRDGKTPVSLQYQSAAEIAELDRQIKAKMPEIRAELKRREAKEAAEFAEAHKPLPKIAVALPNDTSELVQTPDSIKFKVDQGKAKALAETWRKQFRDPGWKESMATLQAMAGAISLSKEKMSMTIHYTDTGFTPAEMNISAMGAELDSSGGTAP